MSAHDDAVTESAKMLRSLPDPWYHMGAPHVAGIVISTAKPFLIREYKEQAKAARLQWESEIPAGWYLFGTHTNGGLDGIELVFSDELDVDYLPKWERLEVRKTDGSL